MKIALMVAAVLLALARGVSAQQVDLGDAKAVLQRAVTRALETVSPKGMVAHADPICHFTATSTRGYIDCREILSPDHAVWYQARIELEQDAASKAKQKCRDAGYDVCEVIELIPAMAPTQGGGMGCFMKATVKGGNSPRKS